MLHPFCWKKLYAMQISFSFKYFHFNCLSLSFQCLSKIDFKDSAKQKHLMDVELNFGVNLELSHRQKNEKVSTNQVLGFKRDIVNFRSTLCSHSTEKSPMKFYLTQNWRCFTPNLFSKAPRPVECNINIYWKILLPLFIFLKNLQMTQNSSFQS